MQTKNNRKKIYYFSDSNWKISKQVKAFTLVELIIVVTILAILAAIAFLSFQDYTKNTRDSNRTTTLSNIQKWLDIHLVQVWTLPEPEWEIANWSLKVEWGLDVELVKVWVISDTITRLLKLNKTPTDPVSWDKYFYWISADNKNYQVWVTLENLESYIPFPFGGVLRWGLQTYANNWNYRAKVTWNYKYPLKLSWKLWTLPSLLFSWTWWDLSDENNAKFIVDKWENIPYSPNKEILSNTETITEVLQKITWTWWIILTGITLPTETSEEFKVLTEENSQIIALKEALWIQDQTQLWQAIYWKSYLWNTSVTATSWGNVLWWTSTLINWCAIPTPSWVWIATTTEWIPTSEGQIWVKWSLNCWFTCKINYWWENCEIDLAKITQPICESVWWEWIPSSADKYIWTTKWNGFCISPTADLNNNTEWSWHTWLNGISWNGWWDHNVVERRWWNTESYSSTRDSWLTSYYIYWQTRTLNSPNWYTCKPLLTATKWLTLSDWNNAILSDNPDSINSSDDTLANRMRYLAKYKNNHTKYTHAQIDRIEFSVVPVNNHAIPALYLSDCIDWEKDLWKTITYINNWWTTENIAYTWSYNADVSSFWTYEYSVNLNSSIYQSRQKYLLWWTQQKWSHLPSAFSYIGVWSAWSWSWEYLVASYYKNISCSSWWATIAWTNDQSSSEWIWLASVGNIDGSYWGQTAGAVGGDGCSSQSYSSTVNRHNYYSARFVVR